jgi:DNA modification methylase
VSVQILKGDCRDVLRSLDADSVQTCITSPPYWGLRDYGIPPSVWGGDPDCEHAWGAEIAVNATNHTTKARWNHTRNSRDELQPVEKRVSWLRTEVKQGQFCQHCGAWAGAFGLEPTYQAYVDHAVEIFQEVRRVLRPDGTLWLNLGDSYANDAKWGGSTGGKHAAALHGNGKIGRGKRASGLKAKDLVGIPWRVAFALQDDGWWLRQDIVWSKPNPMPESVTDRCTKAHEYLFLLAKSKRYYFDQEAIAEPAVRAGLVLHAYGTGAKDRQDVSETNDRRTRIGLANWNQPQPDTRNKRSVWDVCTAPYPEAHFATFPPDLITPCVLAGCPAGGNVLDPFLGAGTTALVADRLGRNCIGIELNPEYADMAKRRIEGDAGMFAEVNHG